MKKFPSKYLPLNPDVTEFLNRLPCVVCGGKSGTVVMRNNRHGLPTCGKGDCMFRVCAESPAMDKFAYELQLLTSDYWSAVNKVMYARGMFENA